MTTFALVHGAWHGGWCWDRVRPLLEANGHRVVAPDLPCEDPGAGVEEYAGVVCQALEAAGADDDVVVVGHSLGGLTIPLVAARRPVRSLVFLCAVVAEPGRVPWQVVMEGDGFVPGFPGEGAIDTHDDGTNSWRPDAAASAFYHDCSDDDAAWAASMLRRQAARPSNDPWPIEAWPDVAKVQVLCRDDRAIAAGFSRGPGARILGVDPTDVVELDGGHSPFLAQPDRLAEVLLRIGG